MSPFVHLTDIYIVIEFGAIIRNEYNLNNQALVKFCRLSHPHQESYVDSV